MYFLNGFFSLQIIYIVKPNTKENHQRIQEEEALYCESTFLGIHILAFDFTLLCTITIHSSLLNHLFSTLVHPWRVCDFSYTILYSHNTFLHFPVYFFQLQMTLVRPRISRKHYVSLCCYFNYL